MKTTPILAISVLATLTMVTSGYSQTHNWNYNVAYHHASTASEGMARGQAAVIRAVGAANLMNSMAARNWEQARAQYINNRLKATKTYFEMRRTNSEYRQAAQRPRATPEKLARIARQASRPSLDRSDLDLRTGKIHWPEILTGNEYSGYRATLNSLLARGANGSLSRAQRQQVAQAVSDLRIELQRRVHDYPPQQWMQANAFVKRLQSQTKVAG